MALDPEGWNEYVYTGQDPINFIDPTGADYCGLVDTGVRECLAESEECIRTAVGALRGPVGHCLLRGAGGALAGYARGALMGAGAGALVGCAVGIAFRI